MDNPITQPAPAWYPAAMSTLTLIRTLGGTTANLLIPEQSTASATSGLGIQMEADESLLLEPVLVRRYAREDSLEVMVAASTLRAALGITNSQRPEDVMDGESRLEINQIRYRILKIQPEFQGGLEYAYRFEVEV